MSMVSVMPFRLFRPVYIHDRRQRGVEVPQVNMPLGQTEPDRRPESADSASRFDAYFAFSRKFRSIDSVLVSHVDPRFLAESMRRVESRPRTVRAEQLQ